MNFIPIASFLGWILSKLPESFLHGLCVALGSLIYWVSPRRRNTGVSNLAHAFPDKPDEWHRRICRVSCTRLVELGTFVLVQPFLTEERLRRMLSVDAKADAIAREMMAGDTGGVALTPHFTYFEIMTMLPLLYPEMKGHAAMYRPLDNPHVNDWVKRTRERFGIRLLSRKEGLTQMLRVVRDKRWICVLYDLNAGRAGTLIPLYGRLALATDFPGLLAKKFDVPACMLWAERIGFWRVKVHIERLDCARTPEAITVQSNAWMERYLATSDSICADWFWTHRRWKAMQAAHYILGTGGKPDFIESYRKAMGWAELPRRNRICFLLPSDLMEALAWAPILRRVRASRADAHVSVVVAAPLAPVFAGLEGIVDCVLPLSGNESDDSRSFAEWAKPRFDSVVVGDDDPRLDSLALRSGAPARIGFAKSERKRRALTRMAPEPATIVELGIACPVDRIAERCKAFGLGPVDDRTPIACAVAAADIPAGALLVQADGRDSSSWATTVGALQSRHPQAPLVLCGEHASAIAGDGALVAVCLPDGDWARWTGCAARAVRVVAPSGPHALWANILGVPVTCIDGNAESCRWSGADVES